MADPGFWSNPAAAAEKMTRLRALRAPLERLEALERQAAELQAVADLAVEAPEDPDLVAEAQRLLPRCQGDAESLQLELLLDGPYDRGDAILAIHPGAGGTESQDWAAMLLRMYRRWAEAHGFRVEILDLLEGEEAGIKSATLGLKGDSVYGLLASEHGVHRLVRMSPFDASGRRHTSFASVEVLPDMPEGAGVEIRPEDLEIDTYRSSGAGGQHVNKTESAVRIRHRPTGIVVTCQNERSQHSNREIALQVLQARLLALQAAERERELTALRGEQGDIAFGSQIRSYVFAPYTLVKDHRTEVELSDVQGVMDGGIDPFIRAYLLQRRAASAERASLPGRGGRGA
jgi:peptide chain release factor 2